MTSLLIILCFQSLFNETKETSWNWEAIGVITSALIGILGIYWVIKTLKAQQKSNNFNTFIELYKELKSDIDNFKITVKGNSIALKAQHKIDRIFYSDEAFKYIADQVQSKHYETLDLNCLKQIGSIILSFKQLVYKIDKSELSNNDKETLKVKITTLYTYRVGMDLQTIIDNTLEVTKNPIKGWRDVMSKEIAGIRHKTKKWLKIYEGYNTLE